MNANDANEIKSNDVKAFNSNSALFARVDAPYKAIAAIRSDVSSHFVAAVGILHLFIRFVPRLIQVMAAVDAETVPGQPPARCRRLMRFCDYVCDV